jgi:hypothetical protein
MANKIITSAVLASLLLAVAAFAVAPRPYSAAAELYDSGTFETFDLSRAISDIWVDSEGVIWIATNAGLGRSADGGLTWTSFSEEQGLSGDNCNAVWAEGDEVLVQILTVNSDDQYEGLGLNYSRDSGATWRVIGKSQGLPTEGIMELAWDLLKDDDGVMWVALWNGGLGRSADNGVTWELLKPLDRNGNPGEHFYSIAKKDDLIWVAAQVLTATYSKTGVYKSEDNGATWLFYGSDQGLGIGDVNDDFVDDDFFPAVDIQTGPLSEDYVWVGSADPYAVGDGIGVFLSRDGGTAWENYTNQDGMAGDTVYAIDNYGGNFYASSDGNGVSRTTDYGENWTICWVDPFDFRSPANDVNALFVEGDGSIWAATGEGLYVSRDEGETWRWIDYERRPGYADAPKLIPFPNPFEPAGVKEDTMTFRYALLEDAVVTLEVRDFSGRLVRTIVNGEKRGRSDLIDEEWTGVRADGKMAGNGVYFGILKIDGEIAATAKFIIIG